MGTKLAKGGFTALIITILFFFGLETYLSVTAKMTIFERFERLTQQVPVITWQGSPLEFRRVVTLEPEEVVMFGHSDEGIPLYKHKDDSWGFPQWVLVHRSGSRYFRYRLSHPNPDGSAQNEVFKIGSVFSSWTGHRGRSFSVGIRNKL